MAPIAKEHEYDGRRSRTPGAGTEAPKRITGRCTCICGSSADDLAQNAVAEAGHLPDYRRMHRRETLSWLQPHESNGAGGPRDVPGEINVIEGEAARHCSAPNRLTSSWPERGSDVMPSTGWPSC
jgi:hypothetical protein